jgi:hypothetical protein
VIISKYLIRDWLQATPYDERILGIGLLTEEVAVRQLLIGGSPLATGLENSSRIRSLRHLLSEKFQCNTASEITTRVSVASADASLGQQFPPGLVAGLDVPIGALGYLKLIGSSAPFAVARYIRSATLPPSYLSAAPGPRRGTPDVVECASQLHSVHDELDRIRINADAVQVVARYMPIRFHTRRRPPFRQPWTRRRPRPASTPTAPLSSTGSA